MPSPLALNKLPSKPFEKHASYSNLMYDVFNKIMTAIKLKTKL
jgi:hypothetical protein